MSARTLLHPRQPGEAAAPAESSDAAHAARGQLLCRAKRLVDGRRDHVLEELSVLGIDRLRVDLDLTQVHVARHRHLDHAAAGARLDDLLLELLLGLGHLGLHLLGLLEELVHVRTLGHQPASLSRGSSGTTSVASKLSLIMSIISSSLRSAVSSSASAGASSSISSYTGRRRVPTITPTASVMRSTFTDASAF